MENLIKKLQEEVGLTKTQALKTIVVMKEYMDKEGIEIDWDKFFKGKYGEFLDKVKDIYSDVAKQAQDYVDKITDKVDDFATKARKGAHDMSKKAADYFDDKK